MKTRRNTISAIVIVLAFGLVLFIGYAATGRNTLNKNQLPLKQQKLSYDENLKRATPPGTTLQKLAVYDKLKSDNIYKQLKAMKELSQVGVIVAGNTALVGFSPSKLTTNINSTKTLISNKVKQIDPSITHVVVSESADIMPKMKKLTTDIANNKPANEISNEINQLLKGVTPAVK